MLTDSSHEKIIAYHDEICQIVASAEMYWYSLADNYASHYSDSADYDKSFKRNYYNKAQSCHSAATELRQTRLSRDTAEFVERIKTIVAGLPLSSADQQRITTLINDMQALI